MFIQYLCLVMLYVNVWRVKVLLVVVMLLLRVLLCLVLLRHVYGLLVLLLLLRDRYVHPRLSLVSALVEKDLALFDFPGVLHERTAPTPTADAKVAASTTLDVVFIPHILSLQACEAMLSVSSRTGKRYGIEIIGVEPRQANDLHAACSENGF